MSSPEWIERFELVRGRRRWSHERLLYNSVVNVSDVTLQCSVADRRIQQVQVNHYTGGKIIFLDVARVVDGVFTLPIQLFRGYNEVICTTFDASQRRYARQIVHKTSVREWVETFVFAMVLALVIRTFFVQAFVIPSSSMEATLVRGDRILVSKLAYLFFPPRRHDIVVFEWPKDHHQIFIKRILGLGGERISVREGRVIVDGTPICEPYALVQAPPAVDVADDDASVTRDVARETYFVLGDNRRSSYDSRNWGVVPRFGLAGRAVLRYWPPGRVDWVR